MCTRTRGLCIKIEDELAYTAEEMVVNNKMHAMYVRSVGFNNLTLEVLRGLDTFTILCSQKDCEGGEGD